MRASVVNLDNVHVVPTALLGERIGILSHHRVGALKRARLRARLAGTESPLRHALRPPNCPRPEAAAPRPGAADAVGATPLSVGALMLSRATQLVEVRQAIDALARYMTTPS